MIFDETQLEAGTLNSVGVENARLLKTLMEMQKVIFLSHYAVVFMYVFVLLNQTLHGFILTDEQFHPGSFTVLLLLLP